MALDVGFWRYLYGEDETRLSLKQHAPEVILFRGCRLEAWCHSDRNGRFSRRWRNVTIQNALECLLDAARAYASQAAAGAAFGELGPLSPDAPAAILRRRGAGDGHASPLQDVPLATMLTVQQLTETMQRAQNGIEDEEACFWSVQSLEWPAEDVRVMSVYLCEATGLERSDIFGRSYSALYPPAPGRIRDEPLPSADVAGRDGTIEVSEAQCAAVQAKTLSIVRFASRFHNLELEGAVLEFVFDRAGHAVLHACWCAVAFEPDAKRKFHRSGTSMPPNVKIAGRPTRRPTLVPHVSPSPGPAAPASRAESPAAPAGPPGPPAGAGARDAPAAAPPGAPASARAARGPSAKEPSSDEFDGEDEERSVLLEVWRGDEFLGEAPVIHGGGDEQRLKLTAMRDNSRPDNRKQLSLGAHGDGHGSALVAAEWRYGGEGLAPLLRFALRRVDGLPLGHTPRHESPPKLRVLLWLRLHIGAPFVALWASTESEGENSSCTAASWTEAVELRLEAPQGAAAPGGGAPAAPGAAAGAGAGGVLRSAHQRVCGADWCAHWGTDEENGAIRGSILAAQVSHRLGTGKLDRSMTLVQLAASVDHFSDLQQAWEEQLRETQERMDGCSRELDGSRAEAERLRGQTRDIKVEQERRLAQTCREMCGALDEHRIKEQLDDAALEHSKVRIAEQRTMVHQLVDKSHALQGSLDKTVRKFDEVSSSYAQVQGDLLRSQTRRPRGTKDLADHIGTAREISGEVAHEERNLVEQRGKLARLQDALNKERDLTVRFEEFVRRIAIAPPAKLRTGGGFHFDQSAKFEAIALLQAD